MLSLEIAIVAVLIIVNGLLAMSELAIVSSRPARLAALVDKGVNGSRRALALASDPGRFLSTVQIGITLVGVLSGAFSGATLGQRLSLWLMGFGMSETAASAIGVGLVVTLITYASLIIGELVPKQIALKNPESVAVKVAPAMTLLARISSPLVALLDISGRGILRLVGHSGQSEGKVTEDEIRTLVREAETAGVLEPGEREMIAGVMRLGDRPVGTVMTPRGEVDMINLGAPPEEIRSTLAGSPHSRLPVFDGETGSTLGIIQAKDVLDAYLSGETPNFRDLVRAAPIILEFADARDAINILRSSPVHMGLVHDEYGDFLGVVTSTDILESIVGTFHGESGPAEPAIVRRDDKSYIVAGWMPADEFGEMLSLPLPERADYHTVAGFMLQNFGVLPNVGDSFDWQGWRFEVLDLDGRRIDKILASRVATPRRAKQ